MFSGSMPALVTPFRNGELDIETLKKLVEWHVGEGSNGLVPVGTTGESPTLTHAEHEAVVEEVVKPLLAGFRLLQALVATIRWNPSALHSMRKKWARMAFCWSHLITISLPSVG